MIKWPGWRVLGSALLSLWTISGYADGDVSAKPIYSVDRALGIPVGRSDFPTSRYGPPSPYVELRLVMDRIDSTSDIQNAGHFFWELVATQKYDELDKLFSMWNNRTAKFIDGRPRLSIFLRWLEVMFSGRQYRDKEYELIQKWRSSKPRSAAAAISEIEYWIQRAYDARGYGYANTVNEEGWKLFNEHLSKAEGLLRSTRSHAGTNPLWYVLYLDVARGRDWPLENMTALYREAVAADSWYLSHYGRMTMRTLPKWGGNYQLVDEVVQDAVAKTKDQEGESMYARLYWLVSDESQQPFNLFRDTLASWPRMKRSFEDMSKRYPDSPTNLNAFALFACMAGDKTTYSSLRPRLMNALRQDIWYDNLTPETCDRRFLSVS